MSVTIGNNTNTANTDYSSRGVYSSYTRTVDGNGYANNSLSSIPTGQTVSGEVVAKDGKVITLKLEGDQTVSARLDGNADINIGQRLTFEVGKSFNNQTVLRPLFANLSADSAVSTAITQAGLNINETTIAFTSQMMVEGMPVNRAALLDMARNVAMHDTAAPQAIVQMVKVGLPLTEINVSQFQNYADFKHQILGDAQTVADGLAKMMQNAFSDGAIANKAMVVDIANEIFGLVDTDSLELLNPDEELLNQYTNVSDDMLQALTNSEGPEGGLQNITPDGQVINEQSISSVKEEIINQVLSGIANEESEAAEGIKATDNLPVNGNVENVISGDNTNTSIETITTPNQQEGNIAEHSVNTNISLDADEQIKLLGDLRELIELTGGDDSSLSEPITASNVLSIVKGLINNNYDAKDTVEATVNVNNENGVMPLDEEVDKENLGSKDVSSKIANLIRSDGFGKLFSDSVKAQFQIKPTDVGVEGKIEELYERISRQTAKISEFMQNIGGQGSEIAKAATNISDNVNFMNQLNEFVNYVQLPLKMAGEDAHGELYVYTKRKNLEKNDGNFSALLHLDMDHLGPMDVYVAMQNYTKVNTHFYLQTEELLDFINSHIDELTKRLNDLGYNTTASVTQKDATGGNTPITEEFVKDEEGTSKPVVSKLRFDVRA